MRWKDSIPAASGAALLMAMGLSGLAGAQSLPPPRPSAGMAHARVPHSSMPRESVRRAAATASPTPDQQLLKLSTRGNLAEVELGRLAITRSTNPAVLDLGTRLAQDGSKGVANLQTVAAMLHVQLPMSPGAAAEGQLAKLGKLHGTAFDRQFERIAHQDESRMLRQFQSAVAMARNGAVKSTIRNMIPIVREHLAIAQGAHARMASASRPKAAMR